MGLAMLRRAAALAAAAAAAAVGADGVPAVLVFESDRYVAELREHAPSGLDLIACGDGCERLAEDDRARALAVVGQPRDVALLKQRELSRLRLVQSTHYMHTALADVPDKLTVAAYVPDWQHDYGAEPIAEFVIAALFEWNYRLAARAAQFRGCAWGEDAPLSCPPVSAMTRHRTLMNMTLGVLGYGNIGEAVATRAAALGMRVVATRRHGPFTPPPKPLTWLSDDNDRLLREADFVVTTVPGSVVGIINATSLALMKRDAVLIPISAPHVAFDALYAAAAAGAIGGAVVDVWPSGCWNFPEMECGAPYGAAAEPYAAHPLYSLDNILALPGLAMRDERFWSSSAAYVAANLAALLAGGPLQGVVRNGTAAAAAEELVLF